MVAHSVRLGVSTETRSLRQQTENLSRTVCIRQKSPTQQQKIDAGNKLITVCGNTKNSKRLKTWPAYQIRTRPPLFYCGSRIKFCCRTKPAWRLSGIEWFKVLNKRGMSSGRGSALGFDALRVGNSLLQLHFGLRKRNKPATEEYGCERCNPATASTFSKSLFLPAHVLDMNVMTSFHPSLFANLCQCVCNRP